MYKKLNLLGKYFDLITIETGDWSYINVIGHKGDDFIMGSDPDFDEAVEILFNYTFGDLVEQTNGTVPS